MNFSAKSKIAGTLAAAATATVLIAGCASSGESSMDHSSMQSSTMATNRFGGPMYTGAPALSVTVALVQAGGGADNFSLVTALNSMLGEKTVNAEVAKLTNQYGKKRVGEWVQGVNFAVDDTLKIAKAKGIQLPAPADLSGQQLAMALVKVGTDKKDVFWAGLLFDHALSHGIHEQVMADTDAQYNAAYDANYHAITNQAFYDVAHALGANKVELAPFHS